MTLPPLAEVAVVVLAHGIAAWSVTYLVHGSVLILVASLLDRPWCDRPRWRVTLWRAALAGPLLTATLQTLLPHFSRPMDVGLGPAGTLLGTRPVIALGVIVIWCGMLLSGAVRLARGRCRALRAIGACRPEASARHLAMVERQAAAAGMPRAPRVTLSTGLASPAAIGTAEICLPREIFDALAPDQQEALIAHEIAHLVHGDPRWASAAAAVGDIFRLQPLNRYAVRRLRHAAEHAADASAVRLTGNPVGLASGLAALVPYARIRRHPAVAATGSPLLERITRLLDGRSERAHLDRHRRAVAIAAATLLLCLVLGPGARFGVSMASRTIPWLAPSPVPPGPRLAEVRTAERRLREIVRHPSTIRSAPGRRPAPWGLAR